MFMVFVSALRPYGMGDHDGSLSFPADFNSDKLFGFTNLEAPNNVPEELYAGFHPSYPSGNLR